MIERLSTKPNKLTRAGLAAAIGGAAMFMLAKSEAAHSDDAKPHTVAASARAVPVRDINEIRRLRAQIVKEKQLEVSRQEQAAREALHRQHVVEKAIPTPAPSVVPTPSATSTPLVTASSSLSATTPSQHAAHITSEESLGVIPGDNATDPFTADWWRCVIKPESGGRAHVNSGLYGILDSTWHAYHMSGHPGDYPPEVQGKIALEIYDANGGFGPVAWNNTAGCDKDG